MEVPKLIALYVRPEFRGQGIGTELLRDFLGHAPVREAKHVAIEGVTDEGLRLLARAVPADQRKRFLEYKGDEFVRSLRLALDRRDRVATYTRRLERQQRRAARTPALEPGPDTAAAAAGLMLFAGGSSCEPIPEGPTVDGCRSSDTVPAAGPDDDDDPGLGPGSSWPRQKKIRTVELTVVAQPETLRTNDVGRQIWIKFLASCSSRRSDRSAICDNVPFSTSKKAPRVGENGLHLSLIHI